MEATIVSRVRSDEQETEDGELVDFAAEEAAAEEAAVAAAAEAMDDAALDAVPDATLIRALSFVTTGNEETLSGETSEEMKSSAIENRVNSRSFLYEFNREGGIRSGSRTLSSGAGSFSSPASPLKSPKKLSREMSRDLEDLGVVAVEEVDRDLRHPRSLHSPLNIRSDFIECFLALGIAFSFFVSALASGGMSSKSGQSLTTNFVGTCIFLFCVFSFL